MFWQNNGGGPWGGGGGSNGGGGGGPWGGGGNSGGGGGGGGGRGPGGGGRGPTPPDLDEIFRKGQDRLKGLAPKGGDKLLIGLLVVIGLGIWLFTGFYRVEADEQGVVTQFGKFTRLETPGLHYHLPFPIESVQTPKVTRVNKIEIGVGSNSRVQNGRGRNDDAVQVNRNASMLTGDSKIVELEFAVFWQIANAGDYLFNIRDPETTVRAAAESVMRELVGQNTIDYVLKDGRIQISANTRQGLQALLDEYESGVTVTNIQLLRADPPEQVIAAFRDVQRAAADKDKLKKEGEAIQRKIVPEARGEAAKIEQEAEAYKQRVTADAAGDANRFNNVYQSYQVAKDVTRSRMYLETMEEVLRNANKVIMNNGDGKGGNGVIPYLPLPEISKRRVTGQPEKIQ
ncbi:FtsH protease activity modulator HflK [Alphaproteobacteria bacterium]|nr:FtsH protease activity modulator HflK [Alphaproteobacteria bacterium]